MNLWIMSDLHVDVTEFTPDRPAGKIDAIIVAGDVANGLNQQSVPWIQRSLLPFGVPVILVPGNHEFYDEDLLAGPTAIPGITFLVSGQSIMLGDVEIIGATLWTDWNVFDTEFASQRWAATTLNDYRLIRQNQRLLRPIDTYVEHERSLKGLEARLLQEQDRQTIVVTHHAPSPKSLENGRATHVSDAAYASDLEEFIYRHQPELWIHGHVHRSSNYILGKTRVIANPRGYGRNGFPGNPNFDPGLIVSL